MADCYRSRRGPWGIFKPKAGSLRATLFVRVVASRVGALEQRKAGLRPVSCVVTHHNQSRFIADCLHSLLAEGDLGISVLVVDDFSTESERRALQGLCANLSVPVEFVEPNRGVAAARMRGLSATSGEFVLFLDGDDLLGDRYVGRLQAALVDDPSAAFALGVQHFFTKAPGDGDGRWPLGPITREACWEEPCISGSGVLFRREALLAVGGFRPEMSGRYEDWDLGLRLMLAGHHGVLVEDAVYHYRRHAGSSMDRIDAKARASVDGAFGIRYRAGLGSVRERAALLGRRFLPLLLGEVRAGRLGSALGVLREAKRLSGCGWAEVARMLPTAVFWLRNRGRLANG